MYILGISGMGHDPAAALLDDGAVIAAIEEGKLSRQREAEGIPHNAIQFCLDRAGIRWSDLDRIAAASRPVPSWSRRALLRAKIAPFHPVSSGYYLSRAFGHLGAGLNYFRVLSVLAGEPKDRVRGFDHHLAHAASAYFGSPFERALIVTLDQDGDGRAGFVGIGEGAGIRELASVPLPHSLAWAYRQVTRLLGFRPRGDEHKTQWLSLGGEPAFAGLFLEMLRRFPGGAPRLNTKYFGRDFAGELSFTDAFYSRLGISRGAEARMDDAVRACIAASLQQACATILSEWLETLRAKTGARALCLAGGLFLNPLLVAAVEKQTAFDDVFVQPAAGNEGTALGAAWLAWDQATRRRAAPMSSMYWGPAYSNEAIKQVLDNCKALYRWCDSEDRVIDEAIGLLASGKIVAWFQGAAEFGPRALGNRSLLASPWAPYVKENLNDYIKHREAFRPFALSIPEEDAAEYFECSRNARFMATMARAKEKGRKLLDALPQGFLLRDGLVRLHTVTAESNPLFWKLLKRSATRGPAPILVNTSFNLFGEPLVVTPRDAMRSYYCSGTDALVAGSFLLTK